MIMRKRAAALLILILSVPLTRARADDGYRLWLRYDQISDRPYLKQCTRSFSSVMITGDSQVLRAAGEELVRGLGGMTCSNIEMVGALKTCCYGSITCPGTTV